MIPSTDGHRPMSDDVTTAEEIDRRMRDLAELMEVIAETVAKDGGSARLGQVDYRSGAVEVVLSGACGSCALTGATLEDGIKRILAQRLDWVRYVDGVVEGDAGATGTGGWTPRNTGDGPAAS